ncbi:thermospermine synthase ACAULIS5-like [Senna tora]|uniref:Thermospermine synthase ACAULIS5-like n=1 Tax=Senna tora TaxID=362788 RepID=A0A834TI50_9FABA|nr:thermospermine synthase ACAULIS5-like [Senna tora]
MGGGEGSTRREVLKHRNVERVIMCEIDESFEFMDANRDITNDERLQIAYKQAKKNKECDALSEKINDERKRRMLGILRFLVQGLHKWSSKLSRASEEGGFAKKIQKLQTEILSQANGHRIMKWLEFLVGKTFVVVEVLNGMSNSCLAIF